MFLFAAALGYYKSLPANVQVAEDYKGAVDSGNATAAQKIIYKLASGQELTTGEKTRLWNDANAMAEMDHVLGTSTTRQSYAEMSASLKVLSKQNARAAADVSRLNEQYQQQVERIEAAREQQRQAAEAANALDSEGAGYSVASR